MAAADPANRIDFIKKWLPSQLPLEKVLRIFKKDIFIDSIIEEIDNATLYYIQIGREKVDELYYFQANGMLFHGEPEWSLMHQFLDTLPLIKPSKTIEEPHWFLGTRDNFTHQIVDFFPNRLNISLGLDLERKEKINFVIGKYNQILEFAESLGSEKANYNKLDRALKLANIASIKINDYTKITCVRFKKLFLARHVSIFRAFELLHEWSGNEKNTEDNGKSDENMIGYLAREDTRIKNQDEIKEKLIKDHSCEVVERIGSLDKIARKQILKKFSHLILPTGSDNINAFCFSAAKTKLIQMIPCKTTDLLSSPFYSYANLRYALPFLNRIVFWEAYVQDQSQGINCGLWDPTKLPSLMQNYKK